MRGGYRNFGKWGGRGGGGRRVLNISEKGGPSVFGGDVLENFENQTPQIG